MNPYLPIQTDAITQAVTQNLQNNILPGIGSGAAQVGGYGGSRQAILESNAIGQTNQGLSNALANLYGNAYQADQQYNLGLGNMATNFYTAQRGQDLAQAALGANLYGQGNAGYVNQGAGLQNLGNYQQQASWMPLQNAANTYSQFSGLGGGLTNTQQGSPLGGILGGALMGAQITKNLGW